MRQQLYLLGITLFIETHFHSVILKVYFKLIFHTIYYIMIKAGNSNDHHCRLLFFSFKCYGYKIAEKHIAFREDLPYVVFDCLVFIALVRLVKWVRLQNASGKIITQTAQ